VPTTQNPRRRRDQEAQRKQEREAAQRAAYQRSVRKRRLIGGFVVVMVVLVGFGGVVLATNDSNKKPNAAPTSTAALPTTTTTALGNNLPPASLPAVPAGATLTGATPCPNADGSSPRTTKFAQAPPSCLDPTKEYDATLHTSKGDISLFLLPEASPQSVNNFVTLARYHYYDGLPITRITPRGWAEVGDPRLPDGSTGPGYTIKSETPSQGSIPTPLIVAMLPVAADGSSGGGLIIGLADQASGMPKEATQIGNISDSRLDTTKPPDGQSTVQHEIDKTATKSGLPSEVVTITGVTIKERPKTTQG
jgi:cyclophilin family peptidyl-prolyl cis-trans isomerase